MSDLLNADHLSKFNAEISLSAEHRLLCVKKNVLQQVK